MPRLILLNGPPAVGKSTLAQLYADEHPLALNLDIDQVRSLLGCWQDEPATAGLLARKISIAATTVHLAAGHDVVVPQLVARLEFIEQLEAAARESGARFCEIILLDEMESLRSRYRERGRVQATAPSPDPAISTELTDAELAHTHDQLLAVLDARPATAVLRTRSGEIAQSYRDLLAILT